MEKLYSVLSRDTKGLSRSKKKQETKDVERFLQKERERVRGDYIPCDKPVLQLSGRPVANATYETIERPRYYQILVRLQPKNFFRQSPCPIVPDDTAMLDVWLSKYAYYFSIFFMSDHPKFVWTTQRTTSVSRIFH